MQGRVLPPPRRGEATPPYILPEKRGVGEGFIPPGVCALAETSPEGSRPLPTD